MNNSLFGIAAGALVVAACAGTTACDPCEDYCDNQARCHLEFVTEHAPQGFVGADGTYVIACQWHDTEQVRAACVSACQAASDDSTYFACRASEYEQSCGLDTDCGEPEPAVAFELEQQQREWLRCWANPPSTVAPAAVCEYVPLQDTLAIPDFATNNEYRACQGPATVTGLAPLVFESIDCGTDTIMTDHIPAPPVDAGSEYYVELVEECPFGCEEAIVISRLDGTSAGELLYAAWNATYIDTPVLDGLSLRYQPVGCMAAGDDWTLDLPLELVVTVGTTTETLPAGGTTTIGDFEIGNGASYVSISQWATDIPVNGRYGYVIRR